jgi:hypothetical protein
MTLQEIETSLNAKSSMANHISLSFDGSWLVLLKETVAKVRQSVLWSFGFHLTHTWFLLQPAFVAVIDLASKQLVNQLAVTPQKALPKEIASLPSPTSVRFASVASDATEIQAYDFPPAVQNVRVIFYFIFLSSNFPIPLVNSPLPPLYVCVRVCVCV